MAAFSGERALKPGGFLWLDDFENNNCINVGLNIVGRESAASRGLIITLLHT